jgi:hypothetical protein
MIALSANPADHRWGRLMRNASVVEFERMLARLREDEAVLFLQAEALLKESSAADLNGIANVLVSRRIKAIEEGIEILCAPFETQPKPVRRAARWFLEKRGERARAQLLQESHDIHQVITSARERFDAMARGFAEEFTSVFSEPER